MKILIIPSQRETKLIIIATERQNLQLSYLPIFSSCRKRENLNHVVYFQQMERTRQVFPDPGCPNVENTSIQELVEPHVASFDYFLTENLPKMVADMSPVEVEIPHLQQFLKFWVDEVSISTPCKDTYDDKLYPFEV